MYETLIDIDDSAREENVAAELTAKGAAEENEKDIDPDAVALDDNNDEESAEENALLAEQEESWSDDPVRMYLTQMGEIPLLTRKEEIALASKIEQTRARFRHKLLECDYVIQAAVRVLKKVHEGALPFDRTVQVSVTDRLEKEQILGRLPHNLKTLEELLKRNQRDFNIAVSKSRRWSRLATACAHSRKTVTIGNVSIREARPRR